MPNHFINDTIRSYKLLIYKRYFSQRRKVSQKTIQMQKIKQKIYHILRLSEKYTKTDMVYLASGGFWSVFAQVIGSFAVFGFAIIVARYLPKDVYGQYKYVIAIVALLSTFSLTGLGTSVFQSIARGFDGSLYEGFWKNLRWSALVFISAFALAVYYFLQGNTTLAFGVLIGGSLSPFLASANFAGAFLNAKKDFRHSALYFGIIKTLFSIGALTITIFLTHSPLILVAVYFISNTFVTFLLYRRVVHLYKPDASKTDTGMMTYGKHLSLMGILSGIAGHIDQILLFHFVGPIQVAIYSFAIAIPDQTKGPLKMFSTMVQAKFVNRPDTEIRAGMKNKMLWLALSSIAFIALYIFIAPYFYAFFFPNYMDAVFYSQIYVVYIFALCFSPAGSYLVAKKKIREQYIINTSFSIFQIIIMFIGIIYWGLLGLIISRVIIRIGGGYLTYFLYTRVLKFHYYG